MIAKFREKIDFNGPILNPYLGRCWVWTDHRDRFGYGRFKINGRSHQAHRWLASFIAERPLRWDSEMRETVNHSCDNRGCVRPSHWYIGSQRQNVQDALNAGTHRNSALKRAAREKGVCANGHVRTEKNTYVKKDGGLVCRVCQAEAQGRYRERNAPK